jgi:hypothetical protein
LDSPIKLRRKRKGLRKPQNKVFRRF